MSAGGISYSGLVNHGKITLPSVDSWGTNMNILKDPPKSIFTRKIDKVGETSSITETIDESSNRACEAIQVYARGVNPSISVSYSNNGNNGGQRSGGITSGINCNQAAKLPYTIMRDGSFRPPVLRQEQLLPLSRLPRNVTSVETSKEFIDFSKKMRTYGTAEQTKEVKNSIIKTNVKPTATYKLDKPIQEPFQLIKQSIQPTIKVSANSGIKTLDITNQYVGDPTKEILNNILHINAKPNMNFNKYVNSSKLETDRYLQDVYYKNVMSKQSTNQQDLPVQELETNRYLQDVYYKNVMSKQSTNQQDLPVQELETDRYLQDVYSKNVMSKQSTNKHHTSIESVLDLSDLPVHTNIMNLEAETQISGPEQVNYIHDDIKLIRSIPEYQAFTNCGDTKIYKRLQSDNDIELERNVPQTNFENNYVDKGNSDHSSRNVILSEKIQAGSFNNSGSIPNLQRVHHGISDNYESEKSKMNRMINENMMGRFSKPPPFK